MQLGTAIIAAEKLAASVAGANAVKDLSLHFESLSDTALPYLVLSCLLQTQAGQEGLFPAVTEESVHPVTPLSAECGESVSMNPQAADAAPDSLLIRHLPNENVWSQDSPQTYICTSSDGTTTEKITSLQFRTIDKAISPFINGRLLIDTLAAGHLPTMEQVYLAVLDIVDALDMGIWGASLSRTRLEPHVKDRTLTVKETVSHKEDSASIPLKDNLSQLGKEEDSLTRTVSLKGDGMDMKTLSHEEAKQVRTLYQETTESEQSWADRWFGGEVETTQRVYAETKTSLTRSELDTEGKMREVFASEDAQMDDLFKQADKEWRSGHITYIPLIGSGANIIRKYQVGAQVQLGDWVSLAVDAASVAVITASAMQVAKTSLSATAAVKNVATAQAKQGLSKAALNPKLAAKELSSFYANPRAVFSPERIAAKTKVVAHNPMKSDMLKSLAELSTLDKQGVPIRQVLRNQFADMGQEGKLIADSLTRNLRYLKQNGWLTPDNINRMSAGLNPQGWLKDAMDKPFRLDVDHIIPKSLAPELKAHPANLRFLPQIDNILKSNNVLRHVVQHVEKFHSVFPDWKPSTGLMEKMAEYAKAHPWTNADDLLSSLSAAAVR